LLQLERGHHQRSLLGSRDLNPWIVAQTVRHVHQALIIQTFIQQGTLRIEMQGGLRIPQGNQHWSGRLSLFHLSGDQAQGLRAQRITQPQQR